MRLLPPAAMPAHFFFVDDRFDLCDRVWARLAASGAGWARRRGVGVSCYHYQPDHLQDPVEWDEAPELRERALLRQVAAFAERGELLSNRQTLPAHMAGLGCASASASPVIPSMSASPSDLAAAPMMAWPL